MTADCSVAGGAESFVAGGVEYFGGTFLVGTAYCHPRPLHAHPHSHKWGNVVPMSISVTCLGITMAQGIAATWVGSSVLIVGVDVAAGIGGIGQSFLVSNRVSGVGPELDQGVLCLGGTLGISSNGGGLDPSFWGLVVGCGNSANYSIVNLYTITGIDSAVDLTNGVWVLTVAIMGTGVVEVGVEGVGWVSTLTLYLLLAIMFLFSCQRHLP